MATAAPIQETERQSRPTWWRSPQRVWLRRAIFQIHLWVGIVLALYVVVIGLSGSALVFQPELEEMLEGARLHVTANGREANLQRAIDAIVKARPGWRASGLEDFDKADRAVSLLLQKENAPRSSNYRMVAFDPYTGKVLLDRMRYSGVLGWITNLHFNLLGGETGLLISGWMSVGLLLLCLTGIVLWWPGVRRWAAALVLHRRRRWQRWNWDLHAVIGFWSCACLTVVTFTGLYFAFPNAVRSIVLATTGGEGNVAANAQRPKSATAVEKSAPVLTIDAALAAARKALPANAPPGYLQLPAKVDAPYGATGYYIGAAPYSQLVYVSLDSRTGQVLLREDTREAALGMRIIQYFFAIHFGWFGGPGFWGVVVKLIWVLLGVAPALLAITGLLMYWNRKLYPLWRRLGTR
ncbi:MAG TPA: PepSY-associated TM helix domain-containing protein [Bryobacteraceae bacterium]|nr:PepSY-associated TM helix domain-containing protein [Bryobacteraceae bacterium]